MKKMEFCLVAGMMAGILALSGCGKSDEATTGSSITLAGTLATGTVSLNLKQEGLKGLHPNTKLGRDGKVAALADMSTYKVRCVTLSGTINSAEGTCTSAGAFSLAISADPGTPIGCFVLTGGAIVATMSFVTDSSTMTGGTSASSSTYTPGSGASSITMGTITLDLDKGKAVASTAQFSGDTGTAAGSWADVTGTWGVSNCQVINTDGTTGTCGAAGQDHGPPSSLYLHQLEATDGSSVTHKGMSVWESASAFTGCGSAEHITLPAGWTAVTAGMSSAFSFATLDPASIPASNWGGTAPCGFTYTNGMMCSAINANTQNWGNGTATYNVNDCKAMCIANGIWQVNSGCVQEYEVNWSKPQTITSAGDLACTTTGCGTGSGASFVVGTGRPRNRFMSEELIIKGNTGSMEESRTRTEYICTGQTASGCTQHQCTVTEVVRMSMIQATATTAFIKVDFDTKLAQNQDAACSTSDPGNHIASKLGTSRFVFTATKQ